MSYIEFKIIQYQTPKGLGVKFDLMDLGDNEFISQDPETQRINRIFRAKSLLKDALRGLEEEEKRCKMNI